LKALVSSRGTMPQHSPNPTRCYFSHQFDSSRWSSVSSRDGDIIVATSPKCGTTWTLRIISVLIHGERLPGPLTAVGPWIDQRFTPTPLEVRAARVAAQPHRRSLKSHLPCDALPYDPKVKYICVGRDGRDVALSVHNHYSGFTDATIGRLNSPPGAFKERFEHAPADVHVLLKDWLTRGNANFPWETQGYPGLSHFRQVQTFWDYRDLSNVYLTHYKDSKSDLAAEVQRIAVFIQVAPTPALIRLVETTGSFEAMKREAAEVSPELGQILEGDAERFFHKGVSEGWKEIISSEELELDDAAVRRTLSPDCARWLETGRAAMTCSRSH
jgi:aryl sulfotransferase